MSHEKCPIANPAVVLREEFDDWAVLFDPDTGRGAALDPVGVFIWKRLDGGHTVGEITTEIRTGFTNVPDTVSEHCSAFVADLLSNGFAGYPGEET